MKSLNDIVIERLVLSKNKTKHTLFPKTNKELKNMIKAEIEKNGNECSLNHIDVSEITDMQYIFYESKFNGDISKWDVSNVTNMTWMFAESKFDGDISGWDVSNVKIMTAMFAYSRFTGKNGDINNWDVSNVTDMYKMFYHSDFNSNIADWNCEDKDVKYMLHACPIDSKFLPKRM